MEIKRTLKGILLSAALITSIGAVGCKHKESIHVPWPLVKETLSVETGTTTRELSEEALKWLERQGVPRNIAKEYDLIFFEDNVMFVPDLFSHYVGAQIANQFPERFKGPNPMEIIRMHESKVSLEIAIQYAERFSGLDIAHLFKNELTPAIANIYPERFNAWHIEELYKQGLTAEIVNKYNQEFEVSDLIEMHLAKIKPEIVSQYEGFNDVEIIIRMIREGVNPKDVSGYDERFTDWQSYYKLYQEGILPSEANQFYKQFSASQIETLHKAGIEPRIANEFILLNKEFNTEISVGDILYFVENKIPYEDVLATAEGFEIRKRLLE